MTEEIKNKDENIGLSWEDTIDEGSTYNDLTLNKNESNATDLLLSAINRSFVQEENLNISLKIWFSKIIVLLLVVLTIVICGIVIFQGLGKLKLEEWTLRIFATGVFVEVIAVVRIIANSIFPKDDRKTYLEFINRFNNKGKETNDSNK